MSKDNTLIGLFSAYSKYTFLRYSPMIFCSVLFPKFRWKVFIALAICLFGLVGLLWDRLMGLVFELGLGYIAICLFRGTNQKYGRYAMMYMRRDLGYVRFQAFREDPELNRFSTNDFRMVRNMLRASIENRLSIWEDKFFMLVITPLIVGMGVALAQQSFSWLVLGLGGLLLFACCYAALRPGVDKERELSAWISFLLASQE